MCDKEGVDGLDVDLSCRTCLSCTDKNHQTVHFILPALEVGVKETGKRRCVPSRESKECVSWL